MGYDLVIGNPTNYQGLAGKGKDFCAITLPGHIFISEKCSAEMGSNHVLWSALLRHEGTHAAQQKRMGASFFLVYAYGEGRLLGIETPAYDVTYSTLRYFALDETLGVIAPTTEVLVEKAGSFYDKYDGTHIPKQCYQDIAVRVWSDQ
jgi:hypothetical protein